MNINNRIKTFKAFLNEMARPSVTIKDEDGAEKTYHPISNFPYFFDENDIVFLYQFPAPYWAAAFYYRMKVVLKKFIEYTAENKKRLEAGEESVEWDDNATIKITDFTSRVTQKELKTYENARWKKTCYEFKVKLLAKQIYDKIERDVDTKFFASADTTPEAEERYHAILQDAIRKNEDNGGFIGTCLRDMLVCKNKNEIPTGEKLTAAQEDLRRSLLKFEIIPDEWMCPGFKPVEFLTIEKNINILLASSTNFGRNHNVDTEEQMISKSGGNSSPMHVYRLDKNVEDGNFFDIRALSKKMKERGIEKIPFQIFPHRPNTNKGNDKDEYSVYWSNVSTVVDYYANEECTKRVGTVRKEYDPTDPKKREFDKIQKTGTQGIARPGYIPYVPLNGFKVDNRSFNYLQWIVDYVYSKKLPDNLTETDLVKYINSEDLTKNELTNLNEKLQRARERGDRLKGNPFQLKKFRKEELNPIEEKIEILSKIGIIVDFLKDCKELDCKSFEDKDENYKKRYREIIDSKSLKEKQDFQQEFSNYKINHIKCEVKEIVGEEISLANLVKFLKKYIEYISLKTKKYSQFDYAVHFHNWQREKDPLKVGKDNPICNNERKYPGLRDSSVGIGILDFNRNTKHSLHSISHEDIKKIKDIFYLPNGFPFKKQDVEELKRETRIYLGKILEEANKNKKMLQDCEVNNFSDLDDLRNRLKEKINWIKWSKEIEDTLNQYKEIDKEFDPTDEDDYISKSKNGLIYYYVNRILQNTDSRQKANQVGNVYSQFDKDESLKRSFRIPAILQSCTKATFDFIIKNSGSGMILRFLEILENNEANIVDKYHAYLEASREILQMARDYIDALFQLPFLNTTDNGQISTRRLRGKEKNLSTSDVTRGDDDDEDVSNSATYADNIVNFNFEEGSGLEFMKTMQRIIYDANKDRIEPNKGKNGTFGSEFITSYAQGSKIAGNVDFMYSLLGIALDAIKTSGNDKKLTSDGHLTATEETIITDIEIQRQFLKLCDMKAKSILEEQGIQTTDANYNNLFRKTSRDIYERTMRESGENSSSVDLNDLEIKEQINESFKTISDKIIRDESFENPDSVIDRNVPSGINIPEIIEVYSFIAGKFCAVILGDNDIVDFDDMNDVKNKIISNSVKLAELQENWKNEEGKIRINIASIIENKNKPFPYPLAARFSSKKEYSANSLKIIREKFAQEIKNIKNISVADNTDDNSTNKELTTQSISNNLAVNNLPKLPVSRGSMGVQGGGLSRFIKRDVGDKTTPPDSLKSKNELPLQPPVVQKGKIGNFVDDGDNTGF